MVCRLVGSLEHLLEGVEEPEDVHRCQLGRTGVHRLGGAAGEGVPVEPRAIPELTSHVLVLLVLEEAAHQLRPRIGFEEVAVLTVLRRRVRWQEHLRLDVGECRRDDEILADHVDVERAHHVEVLEILLGDEAHRDVQDVELVLANQVEQQVERALEDVQLELLELGIGRFGLLDLGGGRVEPWPLGEPSRARLR